MWQISEPQSGVSTNEFLKSQMYGSLTGPNTMNLKHMNYRLFKRNSIEFYANTSFSSMCVGEMSRNLATYANGINTRALFYLLLLCIYFLFIFIYYYLPGLRPQITGKSATYASRWSRISCVDKKKKSTRFEDITVNCLTRITSVVSRTYFSDVWILEISSEMKRSFRPI